MFPTIWLSSWRGARCRTPSPPAAATGCERFDPFVTVGVASLFASHHVFADGSHRTAIGPTAGVGAFYHLTDSWSLRFDATAAMAVDSPCGMSYGISLGLQWSFGD